MSEEQKTRERLSAEYAILAQVANELRSRIDLLNAAINDVTVARSALKELMKLSGGEDMVVPIGGGVMVRAAYKKEDRVMVSIGANVVVEKRIDEAIGYLEERERILRQELQQRVAEYQKIAARLGQIERQVSRQ